MSRAKVPDPPAGLLAAERNEWERVWRRVVADPSIKLVGWTAASWADPDGTRIFPGGKILAATTGLTETTALKALAVIRDTGLMWRYIQGSKRGRQAVADEYRLTIPENILARVPLLSPEYELPVGAARLRIRAGSPDLRSPDLRTHDLSRGNTGSESPEHLISDQATTTGPLHLPLHDSNTGDHLAGVEGAPAREAPALTSRGDAGRQRHRSKRRAEAVCANGYPLVIEPDGSRSCCAGHDVIWPGGAS